MERAASHLRLWLIDDTLDHHRVAVATVAAMPEVLLRGFIEPAEAIETYERLQHTQPGLLPRIVLMDYYLGPFRGDRVTAELRHRQDPAAALIIVGYSSVASCSERIVAAGANLVVRKTADKSGQNPHLRRFLVRFLADGSVLAPGR